MENGFSVSIFKNRTSKCGFQVMPEFVITQGKKSLNSLKKIKSYFSCGNIYVNHRYDNHRENIYRYCVRNIKDLDTKIIPFFKVNSLQTSKIDDFILFCKVVELIKAKKHLTIEGLNYIRKLKNPQRPHAEYQ